MLAASLSPEIPRIGDDVKLWPFVECRYCGARESLCLNQSSICQEGNALFGSAPNKLILPTLIFQLAEEGIRWLASLAGVATIETQYP